MAAKLTRLTHKITIQLHLVAESCTICSSRSTRPVRKVLDTPSYYNSITYRLPVSSSPVGVHFHVLALRTANNLFQMQRFNGSSRILFL